MGIVSSADWLGRSFVKDPRRDPDEDHLCVAQYGPEPGTDPGDGLVPEAQVNREGDPAGEGQPTRSPNPAGRGGGSPSRPRTARGSRRRLGKNAAVVG